jgi:hypothetical protein
MATSPNSVTLAGHRGGFDVTIFAASGRLAVKRADRPLQRQQQLAAGAGSRRTWP